MSNVLNELIQEGKLDLYLTEFEKKEIIAKISAIKKEFLYKSDFHGLHHSEKVFLFAYLIGKHEGLNHDELEILLDAALYHDIGRADDTEEQFHGYASTLKIDKVLGSKELYKNIENLEILKAMCDAHSVPDSKMELILGNYEISEEKKDIVFKLARLLKDADALDRARFQKTSKAALQTHFLRFDYSKELISLAYNVNNYYRDKICERNFKKYSQLNTGKQETCLHGIGFNFSALSGILKYGILSEYAKSKKNISTCRNFKGNNSEMWISVCVGEGEAKKQFVDNGIYFECTASNLIKGEKEVSEALSRGLPIDSKRYSDEYFAFYEIQNINSININPELLNKDISTLDYLNGSLNYETLVNNIDIYIRYLRLELDYFPDITKIEDLKIQMINTVLNYEGLEVDSQKRNQQNFFNQIENIKAKINEEIAIMLKKAFRKKLNKENISVFDAITYILNNLNIDYEFNNGKFILNSREKKI